MRHRKKLLCAAILLVAGTATVFFWPHDNPEARAALAELRELVEVRRDSALMEPAQIQQRSDAQILLRMDIFKINLTDATAGLFASSAKDYKFTAARVVSTKRIREALHELRSQKWIEVVAEPNIVSLPGRKATIAAATSVPQSTPGGGITYRPVGIVVSFVPELSAADSVVLKIECELSRLAGVRTVPTPQGPLEQPEVQSKRGTAVAHLKKGETLLIGGLAQKAVARTTFKMPLLSELPGVGSWFCFTGNRQIEEELIILVTPEIVRPVAAK